MHMTNLLSANKVLKVSGTMTITDETNGFVAEFTYGAVSQQNNKSSGLQRFKTMMSSKLFGSRQQLAASTEQQQSAEQDSAVNTISGRSDYFVVKITNRDTGEVVSVGHGSFLAYVQIDRKLYWQIGDEGMEWNEINQNDILLLPSDSS